MRKNKKGYVSLLIVILIALGFLLSGGLMSLSKQSENTVHYELAASSSATSQPTLQLSTLNFKKAPLKVCGLDIALVIDNSGSIDASKLSQMKSAMVAFTRALSGTQTQFSVTEFSTTARVVQGFTDNINQVNNAINSIPSDGGSTNWQDALIKAQSTLPNRTDPDLVIFTSDGNPNTTSPSGTPTDESTAVADAVVVANLIKKNGAKILALGIGSQLNTANLQAISGPKIGTDLSSDVVISDFDTLASALAAFAANTCAAVDQPEDL